MMKTMENVGVIRGVLTGALSAPGHVNTAGKSGKGLGFDELGPKPQGCMCDLHQFFKCCTFTGADRHTL